MPLYMDCHDAPGIKLEEAEKAHLKDVSVQQKYNVKYLAYWVNEDHGRVFCLMEAPDKESIQKTHLLANGVKACNIVEVEGGLYSAFMGTNLSDRNDLVVDEDGNADKGYRFILNLDLILTSSISDPNQFNTLKLPQQPTEIARQIISKNHGHIINQLSIDTLISVFKTPESCLLCAKEIHNTFTEYNPGLISPDWSFGFTIGISIGAPVNHTDKKIFQSAIDQSSWFCKIADDSHIVLPIEFKDISVFCRKELNESYIDVINKADQEIINQFFEYLNMNIANHDFSIEDLSRNFCLSRSQLYRRIFKISKTSPVKFIRDVRLRYALSLIKEGKMSVSEIALELGFSNPSYFTKCFKRKFGVSPSRILIAS